MAEPSTKTTEDQNKPEDEKKKGLLTKLKESVDDKEEQLAILSTFVRLGILIWSGAILTLAYVELPEALKMPKQDLDPTFIASVFTGVLATFGVQAGKRAHGANNGGGGGISKGDMERLIEAAAQTAPAQVIRVEQAPMKLVASDNTEKSDGELS